MREAVGAVEREDILDQPGLRIDYICVPAGASPLQPRSKFWRGPRVRPCGKQLVPSSGKTFSISLVFGLITAISPLAWTDVLWFVLLIALVQGMARKKRFRK